MSVSGILKLLRSYHVSVLLASLAILNGASGAQSLIQQAAMQGRTAARDSAQVHYYRAVQLASAGRYGSAIQQLQTAIDFLPHEPQMKLDLAVLYLASGDREQARAHLDRLVAMQPPYPPAVIQLADLQLADGDSADAFRLYHSLISGETPYPPAFVRLGDIEQEAGRREEAVRYYRQATRADTGYVEAWLSLGSVLVIMDRHEEALDAFDRAVAMAPNSPAATQLRSLAQQRKREYEQGMASGKLRARLIMTKTQDDAERIRAKVVSGEDFIALALRTSIHPTAQVGGDLGFFGPGEMIPEFERAVQQLSPGEISPVIRLPDGYAIVLRVN